MRNLFLPKRPIRWKAGVAEVLNRKRGLSIEMIRRQHAEFGISPRS